ncbi:hypothetical protein D3C75_859840 [compost metagenome]
MRLGNGPRLRLRHTSHAHSPCSLINRVMHRTNQRIGNAAFVKTGGGGINLRKLCIAFEGRERISLGFLHHHACSRRLADARRAVNNNMLRVGTAQCRLKGAQPVLLPHDISNRGRTRLF